MHDVCVCARVFAHVPAAGVIFLPTLLVKYIFHRGHLAHFPHANAAGSSAGGNT